MREYQTNAGLNVREFAYWNEFRSYWAERRASNTIFRGQRDRKWKLQSLWDRNFEAIREHIGPARRIESVFVDGVYEANRDRFLKHFKDCARRILNLDESSLQLQSDDDWWAYGRHNGLVSPMLDWTRKAPVGAFFAFIDFAKWSLADDATTEERNKRKQEVPYVAVWALDYSISPFCKPKFELVDRQPGFETRQKAQEGGFTRLSDGVNFDVQSYLSAHGRLDALYRCDIPSGEAGRALKELHDEDVHYATLFPDVWGAAMYANTRHFVKPESLSELLGNVGAGEESAKRGRPGMACGR